MKGYITTIGIEVHAELKTQTKMFCDSKNDPHASEPNTHVCPVCMGHPGTLPTPNREAIKKVLKVGRALRGNLASYTEFDRKNYFYPDIPKGYQISQYEYPLVQGGSLNDVAITRVHLEEDTARSLHDRGGESIIDFNRAGVPLMELVTEPVIHTAEEASDFARELQLLLRTLEVSDANMEKGEMRVEANISISKTDILGTKVEVKNLNSFKSVEGAILFEIKRQEDILESGGKVAQETRGWDEAKSKTFSQRTKESAHDYRYFPEPDLPSLNVDLDISLSRLDEEMPELPAEKREKYRNLGLTREQINIIISDLHTDNFYRMSMIACSSDPSLSKLMANYLVTDVLPQQVDFIQMDESNAQSFAALMKLVSNAEITSRVAKDIVIEVITEAMDPLQLVTERGLIQSSSEDVVLPVVLQVIESNSDVVHDYRNGKETAIQYLVGQGMKLSKGSANPSILRDLFEKNIR